MAHTNETTNYGLTQFLGSDKPSWLNDYNGDNLKIDTAMKNISDQASTAASTASGLSSTVADHTSAISTIQNDISDIGEMIAATKEDVIAIEHTAEGANEYGIAGTEPLVKWGAHGFITSNSTEIYLFVDTPKLMGNNVSRIDMTALNIMLKGVGGNLVGSTYYDCLHDPDINVHVSVAGNSQIRIKLTKSSGFPSGSNNGPVEAYGTIEMVIIGSN